MKTCIYTFLYTYKNGDIFCRKPLNIYFFVVRYYLGKKGDESMNVEYIINKLIKEVSLASIKLNEYQIKHKNKSS